MSRLKMLVDSFCGCAGSWVKSDREMSPESASVRAENLQLRLQVMYCGSGFYTEEEKAQLNRDDEKKFLIRKGS